MWDSPGLQDGTSNEAEYLANYCERMDILIYCASMKETRITPDHADIIAMKKLTEVLGKGVWKNTLFVLTFANLAEDTDSEILQAEAKRKAMLFRKKLETWKTILANNLVNELDVDREVANSIDVVPAGYHAEPKLLDRDHWLSPVWFTALYAMNLRAQPAMMKINYHWIVNHPGQVRKEDLERLLHEQPRIFTRRGAEIGGKYGESDIGKDIGIAMGKHASVECKRAWTMGYTFKDLLSAILCACFKKAEVGVALFE